MDPQIVLRLHRPQSVPGEDYHHKDALKWGFKRVPGATPPNYPYVYMENDTLYANTTIRTPQPMYQPSTSVSSLHNPISQYISPNITVRTSLPPPATTYNIKREQKAIDLHDMANVGYYTVKVKAKSSQGDIFALHLDTGSPLTWLCGFQRTSEHVIYDPTPTKLQMGWFETGYIDGSEISGDVCTDELEFESGAFSVRCAFGVALNANQEMLNNHTTDVVWALSSSRPATCGYFRPANMSKTFLEVLWQAGKIGAPTFCIKIRQQAHSTVTFGRLPTLSHQQEFRFQRVVAGRWAVKSSYIYVRKSGHSKSYNLPTPKQDGNAALFDTGTHLIYFDGRVVAWLMNELFPNDGHLGVGNAYYVTERGASRIGNAFIGFHFNTTILELPARLILGDYDHRRRAFYSTIQAKGAGTTVEDPNWTFDLYGAAFFKWAWMAFDADIAIPRIAMVANTPEENDE